MPAKECILAVINPYEIDQPALHRAVFLAEKLNTKLVLASCVYDRSYEMSKLLNSSQREVLKEQVINAQLQKLHEYINQYTNLHNVESDVVWHKHIHKGILYIADKVKADLIVKSTKAHDKWSQKIFTPIDWNILRHSNVNVLLVKNHKWPQNGNVVAAIGLNANDAAHECLSEQVTLESKAICELIGGSLNLVNSFIGAPVHISLEVPQLDPDTYNSNIKQHREVLMHELAKKHGIDAAHQYVTEGLPDDVIPNLCSKLNAELLILGSVGRKGVKAALLGNTAELIIDKIQCDTLVIKPSLL